jgi:hypothetical protein
VHVAASVGAQRNVFDKSGRKVGDMPRMQEADSALNASFAPSAITEMDPEVFAADAGVPFSEALQRAGVELAEATAAFVDGWPSGIKAAVRAVLHDNLTRDGTVPVTFAWAPGYDFEVSIWDVRDTAETAGGITILFKSRYPDDPHPLEVDRSTASAS